MSSHAVCVDAILQFEHSSQLVMLLLGVVVGGMFRYFVVVVLCNVGFFSHRYLVQHSSERDTLVRHTTRASSRTDGNPQRSHGH